MRASRASASSRGLEEMARRHAVVTAVRGRGLLLAFDLPDKARRDAFWKGAYELGLLVVRCGERSIRLRPVLDVTGDIIEASLRIMDQECRRLSLNRFADHTHCHENQIHHRTLVQNTRPERDPPRSVLRRVARQRQTAAEHLSD